MIHTQKFTLKRKLTKLTDAKLQQKVYELKAAPKEATRLVTTGRGVPRILPGGMHIFG
jgi:hypothetical protein